MSITADAMRVYLAVVRARHALGRRPRGGYLNAAAERQARAYGDAATAIARALDGIQRGRDEDQALRAAMTQGEALLATRKDITP